MKYIVGRQINYDRVTSRRDEMMTVLQVNFGAATDAQFLATEANHRINNNLMLLASVVRMRAADVDAAAQALSAREVSHILHEIGMRIETVALLHRLLSGRPPGGELDIGDYLRDVCTALRSSFSFAGTLDVSGIASGCLARSEAVAPLGLAVGELVTNALKYAHPTGIPGRITVSCRGRAEGSLVLEVTDDGVGLPQGFDPGRHGGTGLKVVRALSRQVGAAIDFISTDLGLRVRLTLPAGTLSGRGGAQEA